MSPDFAKALSLSQGLDASASNLDRVAATVGPELARAAFRQWQLRAKGNVKFSQGEEMLFVAEALEQASHEKVACYHASLFPERVLVTDLTAGIGADTIALAARGEVLAFELDPDRASFLNHNLAAHGLKAEVRVEDSMQWLAQAREAYVFADPSRRVAGKRTADPAQFSPDPRGISRLAASQKLCAMKLSPLLQDDYLSSLGPRLEFISFGRECREALVILGKEATTGRFAVHVETGETLRAEASPPATDHAAEWLFDSDPAAVRAHALGSLCREFGLTPLGDSNGYLTGSKPVQSVWLSSYRVLYQGPGDLKKTRTKLRELKSSTPVLKQRGVKQDLDEARKVLKMEGERELTVVLYGLGKSIRHAVAERTEHTEQEDLPRYA
jgi:hypothetical protein